ncbi:DUF3857 domain-containing protein [Aquimarina sp. MMG016]|uniref:DUF3857 domain-containing protein n=1 Tax=Aquimarina sp. MMG016 TaxID=2822690 RepID=UPI001B3A22CF|nr:DUF3857 domain-containing protein [Aquimarina sp. MMG016]MBQ4818457.1 DUF3857 and transglutaminase domain-containing protein [Aquimarina sp. MMG016]
MKILNKVILVITLILTTNTFAQDYKFGKVSKEELLEKSYPLDSAANAVVLYENKKVYYEYNPTVRWFLLITEVHRRVKLYNKNGFDYASDDFLLYKNTKAEEKVSDLKGITYNIDGDKIIKTKLKKEGIFENEFSENYDQIKFTMPDLKDNSVIEYKYKITSPFVYNIDRLVLQDQIPIKKLEVKVELPEYFNFKKFTTGYLPIDLKETPSDGSFMYTPNRAKFFDVESRSYGSTKPKEKTRAVDYKINVNTILSTDIPAFKKEPYSGNTSNYISSLVYELQFTKFGNSVENYATSWEEIIRKIYSNANFGGELDKTNYYKDDVQKLIGGVSDPVKKASLIYNFVKSKMSWNGKHSAVSRAGVRKAYKEGTGNAAEINLMLTSMLKYAGIKANPVLVTSNSKVVSLFPTLDGFDYVISRVKLPNQGAVYLDATDKYGEPNVLPTRVIQGVARVIEENGKTQNINLRPRNPSLNRNSIQYEMDVDGMVKGKSNIYHLDYLAHSFRERYGIYDQGSHIKRIKEKYKITELSNYEIKGTSELGKPVNERFEFMLDDQVEVIDNEMFFSPLLFLSHKENIFKSDDRKYPVDFGHGFSNMYMVNIKIPEGYEIIELPESGGFKLPDDMGSFSFNSKLVNGMIQISVTETINSPIILPSYYPVIKEYYNQIIQKESDQVVLKKI